MSKPLPPPPIWAAPAYAVMAVGFLGAALYGFAGESKSSWWWVVAAVGSLLMAVYHLRNYLRSRRQVQRNSD